MSFQAFSNDELKVRKTVKVRGKDFEFFDAPISSRENIQRLYEGKTPLWIPFTNEMVNLKPDCDPENIARSPATRGGIDGWGVEWVWEGMGAMVRPGKPKVPDIEEWEKYVTPPDPDSWDWAGCRERQAKELDPDRALWVTMGSCLFERLIAVMDFENAAMALIDDDEKEATHRFFRAVTDSRRKYYTQVKRWFDPYVVNFNDDWGSQRAEFFSVETAKEMLVPYVKEVGDLVHALGMRFDLHCCGFVEHFVPLFIEEGFDSWGGQKLNDKAKLKRMYGDKMVFTHGMFLDEPFTDAELDEAVAAFMADIGEDNRLFYSDQSADPRLRRAMYIASRKNFDRLVAEGKAIL